MNSRSPSAATCRSASSADAPSSKGGERLSTLAFEERNLTLIVPDFGVSTAACYRAYDEMRADGWTAKGTNHLEEPAGRVEPRLASTLAWLRAEIGSAVQLAGSGSSMFVEGHLGATESRWDMTGPRALSSYPRSRRRPVGVGEAYLPAARR